MSPYRIHGLLALTCLSSSCKLREFNDNKSQVEAITATAAENYRCDVLVAGGTTAALSSAIHAAKKGMPDNLKVCLVEPTDWPGGQLTAEGLSAIDFSHQAGVRDEAFTAAKNEPIFWQWMSGLRKAGNCWVSSVCYEPKDALEKYIKPELQKYSNLQVVLNTVIKRVDTEGRRITKVVGVNRVPVKGTGYEDYLSDSLADWYSTASSSKFRKNVVTFEPTAGANWTVIDATPFGDVLVLAKTEFLQGVEGDDGATWASPGGDTCGQATVFPFVMEQTSGSSGEPGNTLPVPHGDWYSLKAYSRTFSWGEVWTYRRLRRAAGAPDRDSAAGDLSMQNWNPGNDYPFGYLLKSRAETKQEASDWKGGVNLTVLKDVERHAIGWHYWMKSKSGKGDRLKLNKNTYDGNGSLKTAGVFGTGTGLSKLPYLRDTRRSVGIDDFLITRKHLGYIDGGSGRVLQKPEVFPDTIAIGSYAFDIHPLKKSNEGGCDLPGYVYGENIGQTAGFYIPFRALTNKNIDNLLVAGRTMAQSFAANAAIRLQPIEWHSGVAAGVYAAHMRRWNLTSRDAYRDAYRDLRGYLESAVKQPLSW